MYVVSIRDNGTLGVNLSDIDYLLTPKRPDCGFPLFSYFGQELVTRDYHVLGCIFFRIWRQGVSFMCTQFHVIWKYESKVMA